MGSSMVEATGLAKTYVTKKKRKTVEVEAVTGVDITIGEGEIFGLLGPNGAGKTTTLRMLTTLIPPTKGAATIAGVDLLADPKGVRRSIGYVAQGGGTWNDVTAREELVMQARMYGIEKTDAIARADAAVDAFDLTDFADRNCKTYSGGQRRRVDIALGVVHTPKMLFLDEPTASLDPQSRARVWDEVRRLRDAGMTILLTTHYMDEADALCDRISIIDGGAIVAEGTPVELKRSISGDVVTIGVTANADKAVEALTGQPFALGVEARDDGELRLHVDAGETAIPQIMRTLDGAGLTLSTIELHRPTLDDVFLTKTGRSLRK